MTILMQIVLKKKKITKILIGYEIKKCQEINKQI